VLVVFSRVRDAFAQEENRLRQIASLVASAIENRRLFEQTQSALADTETLYAFTSQLNAAVQVDDVLRIACSLGGARGSALFQLALDDAGRPAHLLPMTRWPREDRLDPRPASERVSVDQFSSVRLWLANPESPLLLGDLETDQRIEAAEAEFSRQQGCRSVAYLPLTVGGQWVGVLAVFWDAPQVFHDRDVQRYMAFADQAAVAVNNLVLFEQAQRRANRERLINEITRKIQGATQMDSALQVAVQELGLALMARRAVVALAVESNGDGLAAPAAQPLEG
jgi:GAF domain-containing protein